MIIVCFAIVFQSYGYRNRGSHVSYVRVRVRTRAGRGGYCGAYGFSGTGCTAVVNALPPDVNGAVGNDFYVQWVC